MNALAVTVMGYLLVAIENALRVPLALGTSGVAPHFVIVLVAFVAMHGQGPGIYWTALLLGAAIDLSSVRTSADELGVAGMLGPHALGYVMAAYAVVSVRGVMMRRSPLALPFLSMTATVLAALVSTFLLMARSMLDRELVFSMWASLGGELGSAAYTCVIAFALAPPLRWAAGLMGLEDSGAKRFGR